MNSVLNVTFKAKQLWVCAKVITQVWWKEPDGRSHLFPPQTKQHTSKTNTFGNSLFYVIQLEKQMSLYLPPNRLARTLEPQQRIYHVSQFVSAEPAWKRSGSAYSWAPEKRLLLIWAAGEEEDPRSEDTEGHRTPEERPLRNGQAQPW